jgi:Lar family restriction alleviation protein
METLELLPCPFCGGRAKLFQSDSRFDHAPTVECQNCGAKVSGQGFEPQKAQSNWNRRASSSPPDLAPKRGALSEAPPAATTDTDKLDDATLAILTLSIIDEETGNRPGIQVDPEFDLPTLARLYDKGFLATKPHPPVNAIWLTPPGMARARELFCKLFCL